jgi:hypothetical protein
MLRIDHRKSDPTRGEDAAELAVREKSNVPIDIAERSEEPVSTSGYVSGHFTMRTTVPKDVPARSSLINVDGSLPFVIAVIPLT